MIILDSFNMKKSDCIHGFIGKSFLAWIFSKINFLRK